MFEGDLIELREEEGDDELGIEKRIREEKWKKNEERWDNCNKLRIGKIEREL